MVNGPVVLKAFEKLGIEVNLKNGNISSNIQISKINLAVRFVYFGNEVYVPSELRSFKERLTSINFEEMQNAVLDHLREKRDRNEADLEVECLDGTLRIHTAILPQELFMEKQKGKIPFFTADFTSMLDLFYFGKTKFDEEKVAAMYVISVMLQRIPGMVQLKRSLRQFITDGWTRVLESMSFQGLDYLGVSILCRCEDFLASDAEGHTKMKYQLQLWAGQNSERVELRRSLEELLDTNSRRVNANYMDYFRWGSCKFDGTIWSDCQLKNAFTYSYAVISSSGDQLVANRPGPIGVLSSTGEFSHSEDLPHDPLGYGFPFTFANQRPYLCLLFQRYSDIAPQKHKWRTELWLWKDGCTFEPISTNFSFSHVSEMVRHCDREDEFFLMASLTEDYENFTNGIFKMRVNREDEKEGFRGSLQLIERNEGNEEYSTWSGCLAHFGGHLYKVHRPMHQDNPDNPNVYRFLESEQNFVPLPNFLPHDFGSFFNWNGKAYLISQSVSETNCDVTCGFFEYNSEDELNPWTDRTVESNFISMPAWTPPKKLHFAAS